MSLTEQINRERKIIEGYEDAIKEAREKLWDAHFVATHDERRKGESDSHWHKRRARNRAAYKRRDEVVEHLSKKKEAHKKLLEKLKKDKEQWHEEHDSQSSNFTKGSTRIVTFDSKPVVEDLAYWLELIRKQGKWGGVLVSGYRSPAYSTQLCYGICGHPTCPGTCGGASSNHARTTYGGPAGDVTDYFRCEDALIDVGSGYFNDLPLDLVHMSRSGH